MARKRTKGAAPVCPEPTFEVRVKQYGSHKRYLVVPVFPDGSVGRTQSAVDDIDHATRLATKFNEPDYKKQFVARYA